jgi:TetR/AcrR family transcriptional repressor of mexJK operon
MKSNDPIIDPQSRRRGRPRDLDKREAVLDAATALFSERGLAATTMESVAERAGVSKMTVYANFSDKSALLKAVFERNTARLRFHELPDCPDAETAIERLIDYGARFVAFLTRPEILAGGRAMAERAREFPDLAAAFYEAGPAANRARVTRFLSACAERGFFSIPEPEIAAEALLAAWLGMDRERQTFLLTPPPDRPTIERRIRLTTEIFARAWRKPEG